MILQVLTAAEFKSRREGRKLDRVSDAELLSQWIVPVERLLQLEFKTDASRFDLTDQGQKANGTITVGAVPVEGDLVFVGGSTYTFRAVVAAAFDVLIGADSAESAANLAGALDASGTSGSTMGTGTTANAEFDRTYTASESSIAVISKATGDDESGRVFAAVSDSVSVSPLVNGRDSGLQERQRFEEDLKTATIIAIDQFSKNPGEHVGVQSVQGAGSHAWRGQVPSRARDIMLRWGSQGGNVIR